MISVIIPTCNRLEQVSKCLDLLSSENQDLDISNYEVIVTDDSVNDLTKTFLDQNHKWVQWVKGPGRGPASNRNNGAKYAKGDWLLFIDDDCLPDRQILREYLEGIKYCKDILVFEGCTKADREQMSFLEESPVNEHGGYLWSCNFMINKSFFFNTLKGFDEHFPYPAMEDVELEYRLKKLRITILFLKEAIVTHPWRNQQSIFKVTLHRFQSVLYFLEKHPEVTLKLNSVYYLRLCFQGLKTIFTDSLRYHFRGLGGRITFTILHFYFALYVFFRRNHQNSQL